MHIKRNKYSFKVTLKKESQSRGTRVNTLFTRERKKDKRKKIKANRKERGEWRQKVRREKNEIFLFIRYFHVLTRRRR